MATLQFLPFSSYLLCLLSTLLAHNRECFSPVWVQLGVHGRDVGESDVVAGGHARQHGRHVVEQELDGAHATPPAAAEAADARGGQHRRAELAAGGRGGGEAAALLAHFCLTLSLPLVLTGLVRPWRASFV